MLRFLVLCYAARNACGFVTPPTTTKLAPLRSGGPPVVERPSPDILLSARDDQTQQLGFAAICGGIAVGTAACVAGLNGLESILPDGWFGAWRDYTWPLPRLSAQKDYFCSNRRNRRVDGVPSHVIYAQVGRDLRGRWRGAFYAGRRVYSYRTTERHVGRPLASAGAGRRRAEPELRGVPLLLDGRRRIFRRRRPRGRRPRAPPASGAAAGVRALFARFCRDVYSRRQFHTGSRRWRQASAHAGLQISIWRRTMRAAQCTNRALHAIDATPAPD